MSGGGIAGKGSRAILVGFAIGRLEIALKLIIVRAVRVLAAIILIRIVVQRACRDMSIWAEREVNIICQANGIQMIIPRPDTSDYNRLRLATG